MHTGYILKFEISKYKKIIQQKLKLSENHPLVFFPFFINYSFLYHYFHNRLQPPVRPERTIDLPTCFLPSYFEIIPFILTFWFLTNSDFPNDQTFHQFYDLDTELDLQKIMSGFHGAFATGVACQQGTLTLPDTWFRPPFWTCFKLLALQLLRPDFSNLPCLYLNFHLEYPLVVSRFCFSYPNVQHVFISASQIYSPRIKIYNMNLYVESAESQLLIEFQGLNNCMFGNFIKKPSVCVFVQYSLIIIILQYTF